MIERVRRELGRRARLVAATALKHAPAGSRLAPREAWLFGAAVGRAYVDNSAALHRHVVQSRPDIEAVWVMDRDSADVAKARAVGRVMFRDEMPTWVAALSARVHVVSHGVHDVPACSSRLSRDVLKVRLGHGLTALKKTKPRAFHTNASANAVFDLVPVASEFEKANKRTWDIPERALVVTGLPRFDQLVRKTRDARARRVGSAPMRILYMPTWRDWVRAGEASGHAFIANVAAFLTAPRLRAMLEARDAHLDVVLHGNFRPLTSDLARRADGQRVHVIAEGADVQDVLVGADALLTDYSSLAWDALYVDKPVAFFHFDVERYEADRGAHLDLRNDLPGPAAATADECIGLLDEMLANGLTLSDAARRWQEKAFAFKDDQNCARVLRAIEDALRAL